MSQTNHSIIPSSSSSPSSPRFPMLSPLSPFRSLPRLCPHQSHLHTISGLSGLAPKHGYRCSRCAQKKWPPVLIPPLDSLKDPLKPPQTLILTSMDSSTDQQKSPLLGGVCVDTRRTQAAVPNTVQEKEQGNEVKEKKEGELRVLSVGRWGSLLLFRTQHTTDMTDAVKTYCIDFTVSSSWWDDDNKSTLLQSTRQWSELLLMSQISSCSDSWAEAHHRGNQDLIPGAEELPVWRKTLLIWHQEVQPVSSILISLCPLFTVHCWSVTVPWWSWSN